LGLGLAGWLVVLVALLLLPGQIPRGSQEIVLSLLIWIGIAQSWNLIGGIAGQLSLGHSVFVGAGSYGLAMLVTKAHMGWLGALIVAGVLSAGLAWLVSFPLLRLSGVYFTIGSSAVALMALAWMVTWEWTGESRGLNIPLDAVPDRATKFRMIATLAVLICVVVHLVLSSTFGLRLMAVRDDEGAAAALGVSARRVKRQAFVLSGLTTGLVGAAVAVNQVSIEPNSMFSLKWVVTALVMVIVGGMGTTGGPILGAFVIYYLVDRSLDGQPVLQALLNGVLVIAVIVMAPNGLMGLIRGAWASMGRRSDQTATHRTVREGPLSGSGAVHGGATGSG
jgi:branched-chain amino acid transport system permease protein